MKMRRCFVYIFALVIIQTIVFLMWSIGGPRLLFPKQFVFVNYILGQNMYYDDNRNSSNEVVDSMIRLLEPSSIFMNNFWELDYLATREALRYNLTSARYLNFNVTRVNDSAIQFWRHINDRYLYDWDDPNINKLLNEMATLPIMDIGQNKQGSKFKLTFYFNQHLMANVKLMSDEIISRKQRISNFDWSYEQSVKSYCIAVFKRHMSVPGNGPRYSRETEIGKTHNQMQDFERHNAEIAAFHLDRLMGFGRVPPTTGRSLNLTKIDHMIAKQMNITFFTSPDGNTCLYGTCPQYCGAQYAYCGQGDMMEFSLMVYGPTYLSGKSVIRKIRNPYAHSYIGNRKTEWQYNDHYCLKVQRKKPFKRRGVLLNLIDTHIFDFLTGNRDRHEFHHYSQFGYTVPFLLDNGQGFGRSDTDFHDILAPLRQCCQIKRSTLLKLTKLYKGPDKLSALMEESLKSDCLTPVLSPKHISALDRRLVKVLETVARCIINDRRNIYSVVYDDR